ncbi:oxidoreductase [Streptomyces xanthochromogenes]|uniref:SDR family NAD(P)-dependent oxidoreductase n=1 Tax=Streptomyces xanthochromogenes TaxID=67384 RepID=UPI001671CD81|nr:SDR family oxidoreductase [Streptomyces xanthochromogenes]GHB28713.1 oxidoreductase [Streptomyces xanthochromogenes]
MSEARVALVTGSSSGIGAATARRLAASGVRVVINSRSPRAGEELAAELPGAVHIQADVSVDGEAERLVRETVEACGRLDILVNSAGTTRFIPHDDLAAASPDVWRDIFDVNVLGVRQTITAAAPHLRASGAGAVVTVSSQAGVRPNGSSIPYAVSKAAVNHLTRLLARTLGPEIRVNAVAPGFIETPWYDGVEGSADTKRHVENSVPLRRTGSAEDVADAIVHLLDASYITGEVLFVDGGGNLV